MSDQQQNPSSPDESANAPQPAHANWSASISLLAQIASTLFSRASFFWFVNLTFMAVSVLHAGLFFGLLEPQSGLWGLAPYLGFAVALVLDLASIVFMQARLSALRMNERGSAAWYLFSIMCCSGLSAFGNLAMSLEDFKATSLSHVGGWIAGVSPWLGVAFPLLIILISIAADKLLDIDPTNNVSVEQYKQQQQRRIDILTQRNTFLQKQTELERQERAIKHPEKSAKSAQVARYFLLWKWLFPVRNIPTQSHINVEELAQRITSGVLSSVQQESQQTRGEIVREMSAQLLRATASLTPKVAQRVAPFPAYEHCQFPSTYVPPISASEDASYCEYGSARSGEMSTQRAHAEKNEDAQPERVTETDIRAFRFPAQETKRVRKTAQSSMQQARKTAHTLWLQDSAISVREIARRVRKPESTVRNWIKQFDAQKTAQNGHHTTAEDMAILVGVSVQEQEA